ncbi:hypothetical protein [Nakamurella sp.]|uniref:hypothetical protein n=1 Tax=Nakamurella sp. TaxID=1869182 RepID=UPI003784F9CE
MTSRHGSGTGGRRVAPWIIVTAVAAVVVIGAVTAFVLITQDDEQATCSSQVVLQVVAAPAAAPSIEAAAAAFDATGPVARSACVTTDVTTVPGPDAATALAGGWVGEPSQPPAMWFPDSAADLASLESTNSAMTAGRNPAPMAVSPVVLAMSSANANAVAAANLQWRDLPTAAGPTGSITLPDGSKMIVALPDPTMNRATSYALQSVVAGLTGAPADPAAVAANAGSLAAVAAGGPAVPPTTTFDALDQLAVGGAGFAAVPVVAADFAQVQGQHQGLATVTVGGNAAGDQIFGVPITASWVDPTMDDAASTFLAYLRGSSGTAAFTDHGLQVGAGTGVQLADAGPAVATALATAIGSPSGAPAATSPGATAGPDASAGLPSAPAGPTPSG